MGVAAPCGLEELDRMVDDQKKTDIMALHLAWADYPTQTGAPMNINPGQDDVSYEDALLETSTEGIVATIKEIIASR